ncbi:MAG: hypothetical protein AAGF78_01655 [Pseudomonadota bacterium]
MWKAPILAGTVVGAMALTGCDVSYPVAVVGPEGGVFRGFATDTVLAGGQFSATNGQVSCSGRYARQVDVRQVSFPVRCSNGLTGLGRAQFESGASGSGTVFMADGSEWQFLFGPRAAVI